jgi:hypothetical protein
MTESKTKSGFVLEMRRKDNSGNVIETTKIYPDGHEETTEGDA